MKIDQITPLILTLNEQENIGRALSALAWAGQIVVLDSYSTDGTVEIARSYPNVILAQRVFDTFANQCNFGLSQVNTEWVLSLDADYVVTPDLGAELRALNPPPEVAGYSVDFRYCIFGHPLRSSLYPARTVLYRRQLARYQDQGHGHRVVVRGEIKMLSGEIDHDDRKPLTRWIHEQDRYAKLEAQHLLRANRDELKAQDKLRLAVYLAPTVMFFYLLFGRGLILDGWRGWYYVAQRMIAELLLSMRLIEKKKAEILKAEKLKDVNG